jgi:hypothetical protein
VSTDTPHDARDYPHPESTAPESGQALRQATLRLAEDPGWLPDLADAIADAIFREMPALGADVELRRSTAASCQSVVALFLETVRFNGDLAEVDPPPAAVEFTRELVMRNVAVEALLRSYQVGHAAFFERWIAQLRDSIEDPARLAETIEAGATAAFSFVNSLIRKLVSRYTEERERWIQSATALRAEAVKLVLAGGPLDLDRTGARLGYDLNATHRGFVVWLDDSSGEMPADPGTLDRAAATAGGTGGRTLTVPLSDRAVAGWTTGGGSVKDPSRRPDVAGICLAFGSTGKGPEGFRRTHEQARRARLVAERMGPRRPNVTLFDDVSLISLTGADPVHTQEFVEMTLGPLGDPDDRSRRLAATLRAFLEEGASPRRTGSRLGIHENTVSNRMQRIRDLLPVPVEGRTAELLVALRLLPLLGRDPGESTRGQAAPVAPTGGTVASAGS